MPIYEYRCNDCHRKVSIFVRGFTSPVNVSCVYCGGNQLSRLISTFSTVKSEESRLEELSDPSQLAGVDENDPRSMARWARKMGKEMGEDLGPEFDEMVDRMEAGEMPEELMGGGPETLGDEYEE